MKQRILIFSLLITAASLTAFTFASSDGNSSTLNLLYKLDSRYSEITKEELSNTTSVLELVPCMKSDWWTSSFEKVSIVVMDDGEEIAAEGYGTKFNQVQLQLLRSAPYSTNFYIWARGKDHLPDAGKLDENIYYYTITPENEAEYEGGEEAFVQFIKEGIEPNTSIMDEDNLRPGQLDFTITKDGKVEDIKLLSSSGYGEIDELLMELISQTQEDWIPAQNKEGQNVDQEFTFFFGANGC